MEVSAVENKTPQLEGRKTPSEYQTDSFYVNSVLEKLSAIIVMA